MLRLALAFVAGAVIAVAGVAIVGDGSYLALLGVGIVAMLVTAALAPPVFVRGGWPSGKARPRPPLLSARPAQQVRRPPRLAHAAAQPPRR